MLSSRLFSTSGHSLLVVRSFATIRPPSSPSEDAVSSPHPVSNLRLIRRSAREGETDEEADLRKRLDALQEWNHNYWKEHNAKFFKEKEEFSKTHSKDELSRYYTKFLEDNYKTHVDYSMTWYREHFKLLFLSIKVNIKRLFRRK